MTKKEIAKALPMATQGEINMVHRWLCEARKAELKRTVDASDMKIWQQEYTRTFEIGLYMKNRIAELQE